jgi:hypothetical protein
MDHAPNFENCLRIARWSSESPLKIFEMAGRADYAELFYELFPDHQVTPANDADLKCPDSNPNHSSYHAMLEEILNGPEFWSRGIIANVVGLHKAMTGMDPPEELVAGLWEDQKPPLHPTPGNTRPRKIK